MKRVANLITILFIISFSWSSNAQSNPTELDLLLRYASINNIDLKAMQHRVDAAKATIKTAFEFDKTNFYFNIDESNLGRNDDILRLFVVDQAFKFPTVYLAQRAVYKSQWQESMNELEIAKNNLELEISTLHQQIVHTQHKERLYQQMYDLCGQLKEKSSGQYEEGSLSRLQLLNIETTIKQKIDQLEDIQQMKQLQYHELAQLINDAKGFVIKQDELEVIIPPSSNPSKALIDDYLNTISTTKENELKLHRQSWYPDFGICLFTATNKHHEYHLRGFEVGVSIPIIFNAGLARTKAIKQENMAWERQKEHVEKLFESQYTQNLMKLKQYEDDISYYLSRGKALSQEIQQEAKQSFDKGDIDLYEYVENIENALAIEIQYIDNLLEHNIAALRLKHYTFDRM